MVPRITAVVPTLGRSPWLGPCLEALRAAGGDELEIVVVDQSTPPLDERRLVADRVLRPETRPALGFSAANNIAIRAATAPYVATVNDDAVVDPGWLGSLTAALDRDPSLAAVQGVNLTMASTPTIDGCGIAWNRWWQAVQIDRGASDVPATSMADVRPVFGVSATAALYRRDALDAAALPAEDATADVFDPRLGSYYEDVDLAGRLRGARWRAALVPMARARHRGSTTGDTLDGGNAELVYGNRWLVAARLLGRAWWPRLPVLMVRDLLDLWQALARGDRDAARGIRRGWRRARRQLGAFARRGAPLVPITELRAWRRRSVLQPTSSPPSSPAGHGA